MEETETSKMYKGKVYYKRAKEEIDSWDISEANKKHIKTYLRFCEAEGLSYGRILKSLRFLRDIALWITEDFHKVEKQHVEELMALIRSKHYKPATIKDYASILKKMFKVLFGDNEEYPKCVKWVKVSIQKNLETKQNNVYTIEDMKKITGIAENSFEACIINVNFEGCLRPSEILTIRIKDVKLLENGFEITVSGKTGVRPIFIYQSAQYLSEWLNHHPKRDDPEAYLFLGINVAQYGYLVKNLFKRAKIKDKPAFPYWFRHSGITYKRILGVSDSALTNFAGWVGGSRRIQTYSHLTGRECKGELEALYGIKPQEEKKPEQSKKCHFCGEVNGYARDFCKKCYNPLDIRVLINCNRKTTEIKEFENLFAKMLSKNPSKQTRKTPAPKKQ